MFLLLNFSNFKANFFTFFTKLRLNTTKQHLKKKNHIVILRFCLVKILERDRLKIYINKC